jgi:hypothetical protein
MTETPPPDRDEDGVDGETVTPTGSHSEIYKGVVAWLAPIAAAVLALATFVQGLEDHHSVAVTAVVFVAIIVALGLLFVAIWRMRKRRRSKVEIGAFGVGIALLLITAFSTEILAQQPDTSAHTGAGVASINETTHSDKLRTVLTVPDQTARCSPGGLVVSSGDAMHLTPGHFAITRGTQLSVLLQPDPTLAATIVVSKIETVVDSRNGPLTGRRYAVPSPCQGVADKEFYFADFGTDRQSVRLNPAAPASDELPLTVSSQDPLVVYLVMPEVSGSINWHLEITWTLGGLTSVTSVTDHGVPISVAQ